MRGQPASAAAAVLILGVLAWLAAPSPGAVGPDGFRHRSHLSAEAIGAAVAGSGPDKDCRGCHDYSKGGPNGERDTHLKGCESCHQDREPNGRHLSITLTATAARTEFQHKQHLFGPKASAEKISCFTCHALRDPDWMDFTVPTAGLSREDGEFGVKTCADCHASHGSGVTSQWRPTTKDGRQACSTCHAGADPILPVGPGAPAASRRPFLHRDHGGAAADCAKCHADIKQSRTIWDYDPTKSTAQMCADCHRDAAGKSLVGVSPRTTTVTRIAFSNFPHERHQGQFSTMTCATCHYPEADESGRKFFAQRGSTSEPVGRAQLVRFAACDVCHGHDGWAPQRTSWHVEGHGVGEWACFRCHDASGTFKIATAEVSRADIGPMKFAAHAHPGVTARGKRLDDPTQKVGGAARACTDCHIGGAADLTSRLAGRPFGHAPHLPANATSKDCLQCHSSSATASRSEDLQRFDAHVAGAPAPVGAATEAKSCLECHAGATVAELGLEVPTKPRSVQQFDHASHVRAASPVAGEVGIDCLQCHQAGGPAGYTTPAEVLTCTKCHGHSGDPAKVARTGSKGMSGGDPGKCKSCHGELQAFQDAAKPRETVTRSHLALTDGVQFHDKSGDCAVCHGREGAARVPYQDRIASAVVAVSIHEDRDLAGKPFNDPNGNCSACHRTEPRGHLRVLKR